MPAEPNSDNAISDAVAGEPLPGETGNAAPAEPLGAVVAESAGEPVEAAAGSGAAGSVGAGDDKDPGQQGISDKDARRSASGATRGADSGVGGDPGGKHGGAAEAGDAEAVGKEVGSPGGEADDGAGEAGPGRAGGKGRGGGSRGGRRAAAGRAGAAAHAVVDAESAGAGRERRGGTGRTVSVSVSAIGVAVGVAVLVAALAVAGFGWWAARDELDGVRAGEAGERHAEQVATDYAVGASTIDHQNVAAWVSKLKANTSPQLANKFDATAPKLEEILLPLKWTSTAVPIAAKVASVSGGVYKVNVFVDVTSTNAQNPKGGQMTVTYNVTVDSNGGWQITDVGGLDGALPTR
ncbi:hypothetical protein [Nocardia wallacei]|uniref:hypothetical protein n=1 Tax=Nocardia wallacei TaxID=480035 RepID=UPI00313D69F5